MVEGSQVVYWVPWKQMLGPWFLLLQLPGYRAMSSSVPPYNIAKMFCLDLGPEYRGPSEYELDACDTTRQSEPFFPRS